MGQEIKMIRVTISDAEQTVSFLTNKETILRLIAGCSANPARLGELLIAADIYQRGLAAAVMADLMEFDKAIRQNGADFIHAAIAQARVKEETFLPAFQVIDEITAQEAYATHRGDLVAIDLARQIIRASAGLEITHSGEVNIEAETKSLLPTVTYTLPEKWKFQAL
jgi:hypothetical protein